ncbi:Chain_A [Hexamita inflata]|uniref:Leucine Rich Repeat Protein n=1 Tax=Hexamita inflata TaxID=28002 RepID=A0AA86PFB5_9EUKA|nr:Chain A [Hexamita inflata]
MFNTESYNTPFQNQTEYNGAMIEIYKDQVENYQLEIQNDQALHNLSFVDELRINKLTLYRCYQISLEDTPTQIQQLWINHCKFKNIQGIQQIQNIKMLSLSNNNIRNIAPLSTMQQLEVLDLQVNSIEDISPLQQLRKLVRLHLSVNKIKEIFWLKELTRLEELYLHSNLIKDISALNQMHLLNHLIVSENNIICIQVLKNLKSLRYLRMGRNQICDISVLSVLQDLEQLDISNNNIFNLLPVKYHKYKYNFDTESQTTPSISQVKLSVRLQHIYDISQNINIAKHHSNSAKQQIQLQIQYVKTMRINALQSLVNLTNKAVVALQLEQYDDQ